MVTLIVTLNFSGLNLVYPNQVDYEVLVDAVIEDTNTVTVNNLSQLLAAVNTSILTITGLTTVVGVTTIQISTTDTTFIGKSITVNFPDQFIVIKNVQVDGNNFCVAYSNQDQTTYVADYLRPQTNYIDAGYNLGSFVVVNPQQFFIWSTDDGLGDGYVYTMTAAGDAVLIIDATPTSGSYKTVINLFAVASGDLYCVNNFMDGAGYVYFLTGFDVVCATANGIVLNTINLGIGSAASWIDIDPGSKIMYVTVPALNLIIRIDVNSSSGGFQTIIDTIDVSSFYTLPRSVVCTNGKVFVSAKEPGGADSTIVINPTTCATVAVIAAGSYYLVYNTFYNLLVTSYSGQVTFINPSSNAIVDRFGFGTGHVHSMNHNNGDTIFPNDDHVAFVNKFEYEISETFIYNPPTKYINYYDNYSCCFLKTNANFIQKESKGDAECEEKEYDIILYAERLQILKNWIDNYPYSLSCMVETDMDKIVSKLKKDCPDCPDCLDTIPIEIKEEFVYVLGGDDFFFEINTDYVQVSP